VSKDIPRATKVAWQIKKDDIQKEHPGTTQKAFLYHLSRASYERQWHKEYQKPSLWDRILAFLIRIIPKVGPLQVLTFRTPTPETERKSSPPASTASVTDYEAFLNQEKQTGRVALLDDNFDTGSVTGARPICAGGQNLRAAGGQFGEEQIRECNAGNSKRGLEILQRSLPAVCH
jgi:hypothetical protein